MDGGGGLCQIAQKSPGEVVQVAIPGGRAGVGIFLEF